MTNDPAPKGFLKRYAGWVTVSGVLAVGTGLIAAGEAKHEIGADMKDHGHRLDLVEPKVERMEQTLPALRDGVDELRKDVREIREWLRPKPQR